MRRWDMKQAMFPTPELKAALEEGWEPFAVSPTNQSIVQPSGQKVPLSLVSLRRLRSDVEVDPGDLRRVTRGAA